MSNLSVIYSEHPSVIRRRMWMEATGLQRSRARNKKVFSGFHRDFNPTGFDHTEVYYYPPEKLYVLITEPYGSPMRAAASAQAATKDHATVVVCGKGRGIWNPPMCSAVLVAKDGHIDLLLRFARLLPTRESTENGEA